MGEQEQPTPSNGESATGYGMCMEDRAPLPPPDEEGSPLPDELPLAAQCLPAPAANFFPAAPPVN